MRLLFTILFTLLVGVMVPVVLAALAMIILAEVNHTRFFAFAVVSLGAAAWFAQRHFATDRGHPGRWAFVFLLITAGLGAASYLQAPKGVTAEEQPAFASVYDDQGPGSYPRWHPANLMAERDQVDFLLALTAIIDRRYDDRSHRDAREAMHTLYDQMSYLNEELDAYGSQLYHLADRWLDRSSGGGAHRYIYRSAKGRERRGKMPVLLLLHSREGNLKAGPWALKGVADELGMAIVAPTLEDGVWASEAGMNRLEETLAFCRRQPDLDAGAAALVLAGYGTGGAGVNLAARRSAGSFRAFLHVASEFTPHTTAGLAAINPLANRPILVLHGALDRVHPPEEAERAVNGLKKWRLPVTYEESSEDGAMLLFAHPKAVSDRVIRWMRSWPGGGIASDPAS